MNAEDFYSHIDGCTECHKNAQFYDLCPIGRELLYEVADDLPEHWQQELRRILRKEERQREADELFRFYANTEEP